MADTKKLTHVDDSGKARMVDVSGKARVRRTARAIGFISMAKATAEAIRTNTVAKGDVLAVARIAGIMAAKRTANLIPLCHNIEIEHVDVEAELVEEAGPHLPQLAPHRDVVQDRRLGDNNRKGIQSSDNRLENDSRESAHFGVLLTATCVCTDKTGIEMEALTAVSVAALTVYDMCKAIDKSMVIETIHLVEKTKETIHE